MRLKAACLIVMVVILSAPAALASKPRFKGTVDQGDEADGSISLTAIRRHGVVRSVKAIAYTGILMGCDQGTVVDAGRFPGAVRVRRKTGKFHKVVGSRTGSKMDVYGRFPKGNPKKVVGTLTFRHFTVDPAHTNCTAGTVLWNAHAK